MQSTYTQLSTEPQSLLANESFLNTLGNKSNSSAVLQSVSRSLKYRDGINTIGMFYMYSGPSLNGHSWTDTLPRKATSLGSKYNVQWMHVILPLLLGDLCNKDWIIDQDSQWNNTCMFSPFFASFFFFQLQYFNMQQQHGVLVIIEWQFNDSTPQTKTKSHNIW